jgi:hypothetical protein
MFTENTPRGRGTKQKSQWESQSRIKFVNNENCERMSEDQFQTRQHVSFNYSGNHLTNQVVWLAMKLIKRLTKLLHLLAMRESSCSSEDTTKSQIVRKVP